MYKIKQILTVSAALLCACVLMELAIRVFHLGGRGITDAEHYPGRFIPNSIDESTIEGYGHRTMNRYGFPDRDYDLKNDKGAVRGLLLGTSISEALQVFDDKVYDNLLEDKLSSGSRRYEIWNLARDEARLADNLALYEKAADTIPHSFVLLQVNPGDIYNAFASSTGVRIVNNKLAAQPLPHKKYTGLAKLNQAAKTHTFFWNAVLVRLYLWQRLMREEGWKTFVTRSKDNIESDTGQVDHSAQIRLTEVLKMYAQAAAAHHAHIYLFTYALPGDIRADEALKRACSDAGITFLDIRQDVARAEQKGFMRGFLNAKLGKGHLNEYGHARLAEILYQKLKQELKP